MRLGDHEAASDAWAETPTVDAPPSLPSDEDWPPGTEIDRYTVIERLGSGGMGVVLRVSDPALDREVALKLVRGGAVGSEHDTEARVRMVREAQAMAQLSHPNVIPIFDVLDLGDEIGLVMEYIRGRTLSAWLRQEPTLTEIVNVMLQAGRGLAAAHHRELVHRDFKPQNVMIDERGVARVGDFGLARSAAAVEPSEDGRLAAATLRGMLNTDLTRAGEMVGTPLYMAPEQHRGRRGDAQSDQYAFCATLWEALYGEPPYRESSLVALMRKKAAGVPVAPSGEVPAWLRRVAIRGLAPRRQARWPDMNALLQALQQEDPVGRRHRALRRLGAPAVLAVGVGIAAYAHADRRGPCHDAGAELDGVWNPAARAQIEASLLGTGVPYAAKTWTVVEDELDGYVRDWKALRVSACDATYAAGTQSAAFFDAQMVCLRRRKQALASTVEILRQADAVVAERAARTVERLPSVQQCADEAYVRTQLEAPADSRARELVQGQLSRALMLREAGKYAEGLEIAKAAHRQAERLGDVPLRAESHLRLGQLLESNGEYAAASTELQQAYFTGRSEGLGEFTTRALLELMVVVGHRLRDPVEARQWIPHARAEIERAGDADLAATLLYAEAMIADAAGQWDTALELHRKALLAWEQSHGPRELTVTRFLNGLGNVLDHRSRYDEAVTAFERAVDISTELLGPDHPHTATLLNNLALAMGHQGKFEEALAIHLRVLEVREQALGPDHPLVASAVNNVATALVGQGRYPEALAFFERALAIDEETLGSDHVSVAISLNNVGGTLTMLGRLTEALEMQHRALRIREQTLGPRHPDVGESYDNIGSVYYELGRYRDAAEHHRNSLVNRLETLGPDHAHVANAHHSLGMDLSALGDLDGAWAEQRQALAIWEVALGLEHPNIGRVHRSLGEIAHDRGNVQAALEHLETAVSIFETSAGPHHIETIDTLNSLADAQRAAKEFEASRASAERALEACGHTEATAEVWAEAEFTLAVTLAEAGHHRARARALATSARNRLQPLGPQHDDSRTKIRAFLSDL